MRIYEAGQVRKLTEFGGALAIMNAPLIHSYGWGPFPTEDLFNVSILIVFATGGLCLAFFGIKAAKNTMGLLLASMVLFSTVGIYFLYGLAALHAMPMRAVELAVRFDADLRAGRTEFAVAASSVWVLALIASVLAYHNRTARKLGHASE